jgi:hypothetical protein
MARKSLRGKNKRDSAVERSQRQHESQNRGLSEKTCLVSTGGIFLVHALGLACLFAPLTSLFNTESLIDQDWGLHFHHLASLDAFWRQDRMVWGYNPFFMAGFPSNTIQDLSIKLFEFAALGLSTIILTPIQWFKITGYLAMASVPWTMYFAARLFFAADDSKHVVAAAASLLGTVYWWNSLPREMFFYGMIGFSAASYLSVLGVALFYRLAVHPGRCSSVHIGWLLFAAAILPLQIQSVVSFVPPIITLLLVQPRLLNGRLIAWTASAAAVSLVVNIAWLIPAFNHRADDVSAAIVEQLPLFTSANPFTFLLDFIGPHGFWTFRPAFIEKGFRLTLLVLGLAGVSQLLRQKQRTLGIVLISAITVMFVVTYFGALVPPIRAWQPLRFKIPFDLILAIAAAYSCAQWSNAHRNATSGLAPLILACGLIAFLVNLVQTESSGKLYLRSALNPNLHAIVNSIARETPADSRVLFEESGDETGFVYDGVYLSALVPHLTGRQLIGGPINLYNDRHHFAEFHSGRMFKKEVQTLTDNELRNYLRLYNIGAVVAFHPASIQRLQAMPGLVTVEKRIGAVHLMKVNQPLSWFIEGEGKVKAGLNRLELSDLRGKEVVLKYHWVEGLTASPPTKIEPVKMLDDPIPFIKLVAPPSSVSLRIGSSK